MSGTIEPMLEAKGGTRMQYWVKGKGRMEVFDTGPARAYHGLQPG
jgi:hypothetical protein